MNTLFPMLAEETFVKSTSGSITIEALKSTKKKGRETSFISIKHPITHARCQSVNEFFTFAEMKST